MRVTDKMNQSQIMNNIQKSRSELSTLQNQASTGKRITKPSDDPIGATKVLSNRGEIKNLEQFERGAQNARLFLETTESVLAQLSESIVRAKELALQAANDTNGGSPREMIGAEIEQINGAVMEMANRRIGERYLFAGHKTLTQPFTKDGEYSGDDGEMKIGTNKGHFIAMNLSGDKVFLGRGVGADGKIKPSGDTPQSVDDLQNYKISEAEREFKNDEQDESRIETRGPANVGRIQRLGKEDPVIGGEGVNIFNLMQGLEVALKANDKYGIQDALEPLDQALNQLNLARAEIGGRVNQLNASTDGNQKTIIDNKVNNSLVEDADLFQVMTDLNKSDTTLKATLETSGKLVNMSLLDFLR